MTKDDIIRLFEKANGWNPKGFDKTLDELERFAHLVVDETLNTMHKAIAHEREQCATLVEQEIQRVKPLYSVVAENALKAIRARGQA